MKSDITKIFTVETNSETPKKICEIKKIMCNHLDEIWSFDLADMIDYKVPNNKGFRYIFIIIDIFSKNVWAIPLKNKNNKTVTDEFSNILASSKRIPIKRESERGTEFHNSISQNFLIKKRQLHSTYNDNILSIAERVNTIIRILLKKASIRKTKR